MKLNTLTWGDPQAERSAVLIHGVTSNAQSWTRVGPRLAAAGFYAVAPDLRGHGASPKRDGAYALELMVGDLPESVPTAPTLLVGHSFGGVMAILAAQNGLLRPRYLVLEDPVLHFADPELPARLLKNDEANLPRDVEGTLRANPKWQRVDAEGKVASLQAIDWEHMRQVFSENAPWDLRPAVVDVAQQLPTLLILPETSFYVPEADAAMLAAALGSAVVRHMPGTGHSIHRDDLDGFLSAIFDWMG
ncbi:MAG: alpha/beta hydrolase [Caldilineaceae bacterium]